MSRAYRMRVDGRAGSEEDRRAYAVRDREGAESRVRGYAVRGRASHHRVRYLVVHRPARDLRLPMFSSP